MKETLIFFDAVGTLIYSAPPVIEVYHKIGKDFGYDLPTETISTKFIQAHKKYFNSDVEHLTNESIEKTCWKNVVNEVFDSEHDTDLFNELWLHFSKPQHWHVYNDTNEMLIKLHKQGYYVGIASNFDNRLLNICNTHFPFIDQEDIFYSTQIGHAKPSIDFYKAIMNKFDRNNNKFIMVGDDEVNDIKAAKDAGWSPIHRDELNKLNIELA